MKHKFLLIYTWFVRIFLFFLPDIPFIMRFRGFLYGLGMKKCGKNFQVTHDANIKGLQNIIIGSNCFIGNNTKIFGSGEIIIEDEVLIAPNYVIISSNHTLENGSFRYGKRDRGQIIINAGSWIASNCTIQKGSILPKGSVLAANSFLNKKYYIPYSIYAGNPAKRICEYGKK